MLNRAVKTFVHARIICYQFFFHFQQTPSISSLLLAITFGMGFYISFSFVCFFALLFAVR